MHDSLRATLRLSAMNGKTACITKAKTSRSLHQTIIIQMSIDNESVNVDEV